MGGIGIREARHTLRVADERAECASSLGRYALRLATTLDCDACGRRELYADEEVAIARARARGWRYWRGSNVCPACAKTSGSAPEALCRAGVLEREADGRELVGTLDPAMWEHLTTDTGPALLVCGCPCCRAGSLRQERGNPLRARCDHCGSRWQAPPGFGLLLAGAARGA